MTEQPTNDFSSMDDLMNNATTTQQTPDTSASLQAETLNNMGQAETVQPQQVTPDTHVPTDEQVDSAYAQFTTETQAIPEVNAVAPQQVDVPHSDKTVSVPRDKSKKYELTPNEIDDLSNMNVTDSNDFSSVDIMTAINSAVATKHGTFRAVALKSGYAFEVEPLRFAEIERLITAVGDTHSEQVKLIKTVYDKIKWFSCGHLSYTDFINCTAYDDFDTILYALYSATYAGDNKYPITCQNCGEENNIEVNTDKLISKVDEEKLRRVRTILSDASTSGKSEMLPLDMREKLRLRGSGIVVEYGVSSIGDFLSGLARMQSGLMNPKTGKMDTSKSELTSMIDFELAIDYMYVPNPKAPGNYVKIADKSQINTILTKLSYIDGPQFKKHLNAMREKYRVDYTIPKFDCLHCGTTSPELALNFEQLLFTEMNQETE